MKEESMASSLVTTNHEPNDTTTMTTTIAPLGDDATNELCAVVSSDDTQVNKKCCLSTYPIGTKFYKFFEGYGWFVGEIVSANEDYYKVWYEEDNDAEEMNDEDIAQCEIITEEGEQESSRPSKKKRRTSKKTTRLPPIKPGSLWTIQGLDPEQFTCQVEGFDDQTTKVAAADFFLFMYERQMLWKRRQEGQAAPWSDLAVFQQFSFCNVYRELDRGTAFLHAYIVKLWNQLQLADAEVTERDWTIHVLWTVYCYRNVNRMTSFELTGLPELDSSKVKAFLKKCRQVNNQQGVFFTRAHQTTHMTEFARRMQEVSRNNFQGIVKVVDQLLDATTLEECVNCLQQLPGIGVFLSWQVACDLRESRCLTRVEDNGYCALGPGARDGLKHIFSETADCSPLELAQSLAENQKTFYDALGLEFPTWNGNELGLKEIEHSLCEYSKFQGFCQGRKGKCARRPSIEKSNESRLFSCNACMGYQSEPKSESQSTNPFWLCKPCHAFAFVSFAE